MSSHCDRNPLLGILALQLDFVSKEQLVAAMNAWVLDKSQSLDELLLQQNVLDSETHPLLVSLVDKHLERHGNDGQQSLAALSSVGSLRTELSQIGDEELEETLQAISSLRDESEVEDELGETLSVGQSNSRGDRFQILRPHVKGGLGEVSVARDGELNREVVLKEIQAAYVDDPNSRARLCWKRRSPADWNTQESSRFIASASTTMGVPSNQATSISRRPIFNNQRNRVFDRLA